MVLQFNPPPYVDRDKELADLWNNALISGSSSFAQGRQNARQQQLQDYQIQRQKQEDERKQAEERRKSIETTAEYGTQAPSSMTTPISGPMTIDQSLRSVLDPGSAASPAPAGGGMVDKFRAWQQQRRQGAAAPDPSGLPRANVGHNEVLPGLFPADTERGLGWTGMTSPGTKGIEAAGKLFEAQKKLEGGDSYTPAQYRDTTSGNFNPANWPNGRYPKDAVHASLTARGQTNTAGRFNDNQITKFNEAIDPNRMRGGNLGLLQRKINSADAMESLYQQSGGNPTPQQMQELVLGTANMLTNGNIAAEGIVQGLLPKSMQGNVMAGVQWLRNQPMGAEQQAFAQNLHDTLVREKSVAQKQLRTAQLQDAAGWQGQVDPDTYNRVLGSRGLRGYSLGPDGNLIEPNQGGGQDGGGLQTGEVLRKSGNRMAVFNASTRQFVRWDQ